MLNNIVGYWAYIRGEGLNIWNEVSVIFRESEVYSIQLKKACIFLS